MDAEKWKLKLAEAILEATNIEVGDSVEVNCGTVWVTSKDGTTYAVGAVETEDASAEGG
jgi:hypothetical protein